MRGDLALSDSVETAEFLQVPGGADQHDLGESPGAEVSKTRHLLPGTDAGVNHGFLRLPVVGARLPLFLKNIPHPSSRLRIGLPEKLLDGGHHLGLLLLRVRVKDCYTVGYVDQDEGDAGPTNLLQQRQIVPDGIATASGCYLSVLDDLLRILIDAV